MPPNVVGSLSARSVLRAWCTLLLLLCASVALVALPHKAEAAITQTGSVLEYGIGTDNTGTVASNITVPADAELVVVGITSYDVSANYFSSGSMTFTKGGADTAMTSATAAGDSSNSFYMAATYYIVLPDTGSNKTLKWDWLGSDTADNDPKVSITFWKGVDTSSPLRDADGAQAGDIAGLSTPTLTALSGDLIIVWVGAFVSSVEGTIDSWSNATELSEVSRHILSDGAWATASPTGNQTVGVTTETNFDDGGVVAMVFKQATAPASTRTTLSKPPNNLGLVGYWSFNEGTGTVATDFSGNGNTGTLSTAGSGIPTWVSGKRGKALNFDGDDDYVSVANDSNLNPISAITVAAWVRADAWTGSPRIVEKGDSSNQYSLRNDSGSLTWEIFGISFLQTTLPSTGVWHHIVGTYNDSTDTDAIYIGGVLANSGNPTGSIPITASPLYIGAKAACAFDSDCFDGLIDEVRVYSRALGPTEIAALAKSGAVKFTTSSVNLQQGSTLANGLVGLWTFDGPDTTDRIYDRSGSNNHGYFNGGATSSAKVSGKLGQALNFDGADDYVAAKGSDPIGTGAVTMSAWIYPRDFGDSGPYAAIISSGGGTMCQIQNADSNANLICTNDQSLAANSASNSITLNTWQFVTGVRKADGTWTLYVNGAQSGSANQAAGTAGAGADIAIGAYVDGTVYIFNGRIDDARIYNRALTSTEVKQLYKLGTVIVRP